MSNIISARYLILFRHFTLVLVSWSIFGESCCHFPFPRHSVTEQQHKLKSTCHIGKITVNCHQITMQFGQCSSMSSSYNA